MYSRFVVVTDHNPLRYLETAKLWAVEQRWVAQLAEYDFEVHYKPGRENKNADVLSRLPRTQQPEVRDLTRSACLSMAWTGRKCEKAWCADGIPSCRHSIGFWA